MNTKLMTLVNVLLGAKNVVIENLSNWNKAALNAYENWKEIGEKDVSQGALKLKVNTAWFLIGVQEKSTKLQNLIVKGTIA